MAHSITNVQWSATNQGTIPINGVLSSDAFTFDVAATGYSASLWLDLTAAPAADDIFYVYALYSLGDVSGAGGDDFSTEEHVPHFLGRVDANDADPMQIDQMLKWPYKSVIIYADGQQEGGNSTTCNIRGLINQFT